MKKYINKFVCALLMFLVFSVSAVPVSDYTAGELETLGTGRDLSGFAWVEKLDGTTGIAYVDNKTGIVNFPNGSCGVGGDLEAVAQYEVGKLYTVNESRNGLSVIDMDDCSWSRRILLNGVGSSGGDGIEGVDVHNGVVYVLDEMSASIYSFIDDGFSTSYSPSLLFSVPGCSNAGDLSFNGDNIVVVCESSPTILEYTLLGEYVSEKDYPLNNAEAIYFEGDQMCAGGEPNEKVCFTANDFTPPPPPPVDTFETCTFSDSIEVNVDTGAFDSQIVNFVCPTITASGTLN